jgi:hypothetical protein
MRIAYNLPHAPMLAKDPFRGGIRYSLWLHNRLHNGFQNVPKMPVNGYFGGSNLLKTHTPRRDAPPVAPRVAGSNPVAHPNSLLEFTRRQIQLLGSRPLEKIIGLWGAKIRPEPSGHRDRAQRMGFVSFR